MEKEIGSITYDREVKCSYCGGRYTTLYEFGKSKEEIINNLQTHGGKGFCGSCAIEHIIKMDDVNYHGIETDDLRF